MIAGNDLAIQKNKARGEDTRERLLETAIRLFSEHGYDGVSTRDIAAGAETTLPSIPHHFGSKEGLYQAVIVSIAEQMTARIMPASEAAWAVARRKQATRKEKIGAIEELVLAFSRGLLQNDLVRARLMIQEQLRPTAALAPVLEMFQRHLFGPIAELVKSLDASKKTEASDARLKAMALLGRVFIFHLGRNSVLTMMGWQELTPARVDVILEFLRTDIRSAFD